MARAPYNSRRGFVLLDVMIGVAVFAAGVLALGAAVNNCLDGQAALDEADRARLALDNRMSEILVGAVRVDGDAVEKLEDAFAGMTLRQASVPVEAKDREGNDIAGINAVTLEVRWTSGRQEQIREVTFYVTGT